MRLYTESQRSCNQGRTKQRELSLQRQAYQKAKKVKEDVDADIVKENIDKLREIHRAIAMDQDTERWWDNPLIEAGREFHESLDIGEVKRCVVCLEKYPFIEIGPRNNKCTRCTKSQVFAKNNNLTPEEAPQCLKDLNQVEVASIRQNCPVMFIFTKGSSGAKASRGHCLCFTQDVKSFAKELPQKPENLPYLLLKNPKESVTDDFFKVSRSKIIKALQWLQANNPYYKDIVISPENAREYPEDDYLTTIRTADPDTYNIPEARASACNEESATEAASTIDLPPRHQAAMDMFKQALENDPQQEDPRRGLTSQQSVEEGGNLPDIEAVEAEDERRLNESLNLNDSIPGEPAEEAKMDWPKRGQLASEFDEGFLARCFPELFPRNIDRDGESGASSSRRETGDITEPREGKNPSMAEYIKHLLRYSRAFAQHSCFGFYMTNLLRRQMCLARGSVFARHCAKDLTLDQLKKAMEDGDDRVFRKLLHFSSPIPGTMQYMRHQSDLCLSYNKWLRIKSKMFNFFQTFSAADLHAYDLHKLLPGHEKYLDKIPCDDMEAKLENEKHLYISKVEDHRLRAEAVRNSPDIVDFWFVNRIEKMLEHVLGKTLGVKDYIIRYEAQHRGTIHAHLLLSMPWGPSASDLKYAYIKEEQENASTGPSTMNTKIREAKVKVEDFTTVLGVSAVHPEKNPQDWPPPEGQANRAPPTNVLRQRFTDIEYADEDGFQERYKNLINRNMLHKCREAYCLHPKRKDKETGKMTCRFGFPMEYVGFAPIWDGTGSSLQDIMRKTEEFPQGAGIKENEHGSELFILRNHRRLVSHIPELLNIWGCNIEGRPVRSYQQVVRYLLKYMMKEEPNSEPFNAIMKAAIEDVDPEDPVKKVFQKTLNKTIGNHDMSKQECMHILNGLPFVTFPKKFAYANVMGTRRVESLDAQEQENPSRQVKVAKNLADLYWSRDSDPRYKKACEEFEKKGESTSTKHPRDVSLYEFISKYRADWKMNVEEKVPHITPNFSRIPRKKGSLRRYEMFLRSILLTYVSGTNLDDIELLSTTDLEEECRFFCEKPECPQLVREEFEESQQVDEGEGGDEDAIGDDEDDDSESFDNPGGSQEELLIEPEAIEEQYQQAEAYERLYGQINNTAPEGRDDECLYDDSEFREKAKLIDWNEDARKLDITTEDKFRELATWLNTQKDTWPLHRDLAASGGLPSDLNSQQFKAFAVLRNHLLDADRKGVRGVPQLLLNVNGAAGTGKTFWLNTLRRWAKEDMSHHGSEFILTAAPTGAAAFLIGGSTLHSLLYLPTNLKKNQPLRPLDASRLKGLQEKFNNVAVLVIDEKSMIGQKTFWMISERLKEARPQAQDQPFGGVSVVLLGDFRQLPPVADSAIHHNSGGDWTAGYNLYQHFKRCILFKKVQRQEGDDQKKFREELERLGNGEFTIEDWRNWGCRNLNRLPEEEKSKFMANATKACAYKKDMESFNIQRIKAISTPIAPLTAKGDKTAEAEKESGLLSHLLVCKGMKFRLTSNLWTAAGLVNGSIGYIHSIIYDKKEKPSQLPKAIIATFPGYIGPSYLGIENAVPIVPVRRTWISKGNERSCTQLPIIPGYALTIHKLQGGTEQLVILNAGPTEYAAGLLLVGATRTKHFEDLAFEPFPNFDRFAQVNKSEEIKRRKKEEARMAHLETATLQEFWETVKECCDIYGRDLHTMSDSELYHRKKSNAAMSTPTKPHPPPLFEPPTLPNPPPSSEPPTMPYHPGGWRVPSPLSEPHTVPYLAMGAIGTVSTQGMAEADKILRHRNLSWEYFCKNDTTGDGNCFFHAIADQLLNDPEIRGSVALRARDIITFPADEMHLIIRQRVVNFARRSEEVNGNLTLLNMLKSEEDQDRQNNPPGREMDTIWREYLWKMRKPGEWATELIVMAAAIYFGKTIKVIKEDYVWLWEGGEQAVDYPMVIVNIGDKHFQSVHRKP